MTSPGITTTTSKSSTTTTNNAPSSSSIKRRITTVDVGDMTVTTVEEYDDDYDDYDYDDGVDDDVIDDDEGVRSLNNLGVQQEQQQQQELPVIIRRERTRHHQHHQHQQYEQRDWSHYVSTLIAGVGSGALASIICAPLDLMRTRMQVWGDIQQQQQQNVVVTATSTQATSTSTRTRTTTPQQQQQTITPRTVFHELLQREGWKGMFRGLGVTLVTVPLFWGVYFPLYDETKHYLSAHHNKHGQYHEGFIHMTSAVFTGAVADIICNPLFVVRTRLQTQALHQIIEQPQQYQQQQQQRRRPPPPGIIQTARALYERHGITIFWRGMSANLIGLSHVAVQFPAYESLKKYFRNRHEEDRTTQQHETVPELLLASGLAKSGASLLSYPHEVLRSRMMDNRSTIPPTLIGTAKHIIHREGIGGLYNGLSVTLLRVIPNCCVTFLSYELILRQCKSMMVPSSSSSSY